MSDNKKINIAIVDDHIAIREGYALVISRFDFVNSIHTFSSPSEVYKDIIPLEIDIILMDIEMKSEDGISACSHIKVLYPEIKILIVSAHHSETYIIDAFNKKADGYFFKEQGAEELKDALRQLMAGRKYYHEEVKMLMFERQIRNNENEHISSAELSTREKDILEMICRGMTTKQIAEAFFRSENTINTHRKALMKKIGAHREADIIQFGIKAGIIKGK